MFAFRDAVISMPARSIIRATGDMKRFTAPEPQCHAPTEIDPKRATSMLRGAACRRPSRPSGRYAPIQTPMRSSAVDFFGAARRFAMTAGFDAHAISSQG